MYNPTDTESSLHKEMIPIQTVMDKGYKAWMKAMYAQYVISVCKHFIQTQLPLSYKAAVCSAVRNGASRRHRHKNTHIFSSAEISSDGWQSSTSEPRTIIASWLKSPPTREHKKVVRQLRVSVRQEFVKCGRESEEKFAAANCINAMSLSIFLIKPAQLVKPKTLGYKCGSFFTAGRY